ncbi:MAG: hypothetical protein NTU73_06310, partial [Ignavibacteriae bacterium]|nr:hypothetical protein [Ignavibacteriota bacterium]
MKKLFLLLSFIFVSFISSNAQELPCLTKVHPDTSSIPKYLRPGWGQVDAAKVIIVFVDFPDGRYINGNDTLQPLDTAQLKLVLHKDAAGEVGLSTEFNNFYVGENPITHLDLYMKPAKYSWHDRWQMYFSKDGSYNGMVHPDNISNGEYA